MQMLTIMANKSRFVIMTDPTFLTNDEYVLSGWLEISRWYYALDHKDGSSDLAVGAKYYLTI